MSNVLMTLNPTECEQLLKWMNEGRAKYVSKKRIVRDYLITLLMLDAGLRVGEAVKLKVYDLFFGKSPVLALIVRSEIAKRHVERSIPMSERLRSTIAAMYSLNRSWQHAQCTDWAFKMDGSERPLTTRTVQIIIKAASRRAIDRPIHPHVLRHTFATRLMQKTNIRVVQKLLGHASLVTTQIYTHPNSQDLSNAIKLMD